MVIRKAQHSKWRDLSVAHPISLTVVKGKNGCFSQISPQLLQVEFNYCNVEMVLAVGFEGHLENINQLEQAALWTGDTQRRKILVWAKSVPCSDQKASSVQTDKKRTCPNTVGDFLDSCLGD
ncbi:MAG: hypothetical protein A3E23_23325 [Burkholderiales bacterium RIFCSPHIGHO2_12_FULL_65_48]|nr:MAG: hypothetical protein A3C40_20785 [Burkholderiales bacterium RIFCSPHIGHO2_02_FULL_64_19]OGB19386.1 MAG: hypothetical protein A3E23_23325 [Burkholderiales bacterium RIFCSPHIGHO2_12_FULL_65_48]OGB52391.1 MAG: hypothetical protein A3F71_07100 [Burkholderiales bacterium RIFCSPLOWO2_12_FULL_64_33]